MQHPVTENLKKLKLTGMLDAWENQANDPECSHLLFDERFSLIVDNEVAVRESKGLQNRLRKAKLRQNACMQNIDYKVARGLDKTLIMSLGSCQWINDHKNVLIVGATGTGKTFFGEALAHNACINGYKAHHLRLPRFFDELSLSKADGRYRKWMAELERYDVLLLDDLGMAPLNDEQRRDLLELIDERHGRRSTIVTSQLPIKLWHDAIGNTTIADAILDRLLHNAYRIEIKGESMRKLQNRDAENRAIR